MPCKICSSRTGCKKRQQRKAYEAQLPWCTKEAIVEASRAKDSHDRAHHKQLHAASAHHDLKSLHHS